MTSSQRINLFLRLVLKIVALAAMAYWSWNQNFELVPQLVRSISIVIFALLVWGVFTVTNDPFNSSKTIVPVNGVFRLLVELAFFFFAVFCIYNTGYERWSWIYSNLVLLHLAFSHQRIMKILKGK